MGENTQQNPPVLGSEQYRVLIKTAIDKNIMLRGLLLSFGLYDNFVQNLPDLIIVILSTDQGREIMERMGFYELIEKFKK